jgi:hypothetical protein
MRGVRRPLPTVPTCHGWNRSRVGTACATGGYGLGCRRPLPPRRHSAGHTRMRPTRNGQSIPVREHTPGTPRAERHRSRRHREPDGPCGERQRVAEALTRATAAVKAEGTGVVFLAGEPAGSRQRRAQLTHRSRACFPSALDREHVPKALLEQIGAKRPSGFTSTRSTVDLPAPTEAWDEEPGRARACW